MTDALAHAVVIGEFPHRGDDITARLPNPL
jgi:hypothetical protein